MRVWAPRRRTCPCKRYWWKLADCELFPLSLPYHFFDTAFDDVALDETEMIQEELAVQVIHLVAEGARQEVRTFHNDIFAIKVYSPDYDLLRTNDFRRKPGHAQAPFLFVLFAVGGNNLRIHDCDEL